MSRRLFKNLEKQIKTSFIEQFKDTLWVYLKRSNSMGSAFDPYRNTGYSFVLQSPIAMKARVRRLSPDSLIRKEIGIINIGSIEIEMEDRYVEALKIADKISYNKENYTPYLKAAGNQMQITKGEFGISKVLLFREGN